MKNPNPLLILLVLIASTILAPAQETPENKVDHDALRAMLIDGEKALNDKRIDDIVKHFHPNANVIFQNGEVADGVDAIRAFYEKMLKGSNPVLRDFSTKASADVLSELYGNTAISYGTTNDHYSFVDGTEIDLTSKWTATMINENGQWKVVSMQFTSNLFDNPLLAKATTSAKYFGIGGLVVGIIIGMLAFRFFRKKSTS